MAEDEVLDKFKQMLDEANNEMKTCYGEHCKVLENKIAELEGKLGGHDLKEMENQIRECVGEECRVLHEKMDKAFPKQDTPEPERDKLPPKDEREWTRCGGCGVEFQGTPLHCPCCDKRLAW